MAEVPVPVRMSDGCLLWQLAVTYKRVTFGSYTHALRCSCRKMSQTFHAAGRAEYSAAQSFVENLAVPGQLPSNSILAGVYERAWPGLVLRHTLSSCG